MKIVYDLFNQPWSPIPLLITLILFVIAYKKYNNMKQIRELIDINVKDNIAIGLKVFGNAIFFVGKLLFTKFLVPTLTITTILSVFGNKIFNVIVHTTKLKAVLIAVGFISKDTTVVSFVDIATKFWVKTTIEFASNLWKLPLGFINIFKDKSSVIMLFVVIITVFMTWWAYKKEQEAYYNKKANIISAQNTQKLLNQQGEQ